MNHASTKIIRMIPAVKIMISKNPRAFQDSYTSDDSDDIELIFAHLASFFEYPEDIVFDLNYLRFLSSDWLTFALECIHEYYHPNAYKLTKTDPMIIRESVATDMYLNQTDIANYLNDKGVPFTRQKVHLYLSRNSFPEPDLTVGKQKFWFRETAEAYLNNAKSKKSGE